MQSLVSIRPNKASLPHTYVGARLAMAGLSIERAALMLPTTAPAVMSMLRVAICTFPGWHISAVSASQIVCSDADWLNRNRIESPARPDP